MNEWKNNINIVIDGKLILYFFVLKFEELDIGINLIKIIFDLGVDVNVEDNIGFLVLFVFILNNIGK